MNALKLMLVSVMLFATAAIAEENAGAKDSTTVGTALKKGAKSLLFQTVPNYGLITYNGVFGCKHHFSEKQAIALKLLLGFKTSHEESSSLETVGDDNGYEWYLEINPEYLFYFKKSATVFIFISPGALLCYSYDYSKEKSEDFEVDDYYRGERRIENKTWYAGLTTGFGLEIFLAKEVSFIGEYRLELTYEWTDAISERWSYHEDPEDNYYARYVTESTGMDLRYRRLDVGFCIYF